MYVTKIKMMSGCYNSNDLTEIDSVYITGCSNPGFYKKATIYDYLKKNPETIKVDRYPYPFVVPALSSAGKKYVRSSANDYTKDNLLSLPRE